MRLNRRGFLSATSAGAVLQTGAASANTPPSDRVRVALIGCGGMGRMDLTDFLRNPDVDAVAVCDVDAARAESARTIAGPNAAVFGDYRRILDRKDVDAVIVATPDHWHPLMTVDACNAGKDVYVEKPVSWCVREGRLMVDAARRNRRVVQVGLQQRSGTHFQRAVRAVQDGRIGDVHYVQAWTHFYSPDPKGMGFPPDADPPAGFDWDMFLGPAPAVPFNPARRNFRAFNAYGGGEMVNWGPHLIDVVHWAMEVDAPRTIAASGGKLYMRDCRDCEDTVQAVFEYPSFLVQYSALAHNSFGHNGHPGNKPFGSYGIQFHGTKATLFVDRAGYDIVPQSRQAGDKGAQSFREAYDDLSGLGLHFTPESAPERGTSSLQHMPHVRNFLDCIKSRSAPAAEIEIGHRTTTACLLTNIALRTNQKLQWDAVAERITNSADANQLLTRTYRKPWALPGL